MTHKQYEFRLSEGGQHYDSELAANAEDALEIAVRNFDESVYQPVESTTWVDITVYCPETDESASTTMTVHPVEPQCSAAKHHWYSPEFLGGCKENPGVWGHGGGAIITECCMHCGCARITDTWAQRPDTGEQGLESISYIEGQFAEEIAQES